MDPNIIQDLPEKQEMKVYCNLTKEQATLYEAVVQEMMRKIEDASGIERKGAVLAALTRLKQVTDHPVLFHFDRWWNPAVENQATDRAFRIGQSRTVQVHKFICAGTLEEKIDELIESKKALAENVIGTGEGWITEMSTDELRELFKLNQDAISE